MRRLVAAITIAAMALTACGGTEATRRPRTANGGPITTTAPPPLDGTNFVLDQHFWHGGFRVELESADVWTSQTRFTNRVSYWLTLRGRFENLGVDPAVFDPEMAVLFDGLVLSTRQGQAPQAGAGSAAPGELTFLVSDDFEYQRAELLVGAPGENRARVPLGPEGEAVRLEPSEPSISGAAVMNLLEVNLTSAELRYDDPLTHSTIEEDKMALTLNFDVLSRKEGNWQLFADNFALLLPDGTSATPDRVELGSFPGSEEGLTTEDRYVRFTIDATTSGEFVLRIMPGEWFVIEDGVAEAEIEFSI